MYNISSGALAALKSDAPQGLSIQVDAIGGKLDLDESDFVGDITITRRCVSGDKIEIGTAIAAEFKATLQNYDGRFDSYVFEGAEMFVRFSIPVGETVEYIPIGYFTIDEPPRKLSTISITAFDRMARFNRPYNTATAYPASLYQLLSDACTKCGVTLATASGSLANSAYSPPKRPDSDGLTYRKIVEWIAELTGTCAWIDWEGKLRLSWYANTAARITPADRFTSDMQESPIIVTGVQITANDEGETVYLAGSDTYALNIEGNLLAQDNFQSLCDGLDAKIGGFIYQPYTCTTKGYPHLWPLDKITYEDKDGVAHASIITDHTIKLNGNSALAAKGVTAQRNGYATSAPLTSKERAILERMKAQTNRKLSTMQQAALELNETMANSMGLYSTTTVNPDMSVTAYWHDKPTLEESKYVYTRNAGGYAWTDSGWNDGEPVWQYGVTKDGIAILNVLHVYKLTADYLDVRGLTVTNASGLETLKISPQGDVSLNVKSLSITGNQVATKGDVTNGLNGLQVGGKNLLLNTGKMTTTSYWGCSKETGVASVALADTDRGKAIAFQRGADCTGWFFCGNSSLGSKGFKFSPGDNYTLSFWAKTNRTPCTLSQRFCDGNSTNQSIWFPNMELSTGWQKYTATATATAAGNTNFLYFTFDVNRLVYITDVKLEIGSKATDWTPAPEDRAYLVNTLSPTQADGIWLGSDGKLNITATQIKAGKLQAKNGQSYFDLENGKIVGENAEMTGSFTAKSTSYNPGNKIGTSVSMAGFSNDLEGYAGIKFNDYTDALYGVLYGMSSNGESVIGFGMPKLSPIGFPAGFSITSDGLVQILGYKAYFSKNLQCGYVDVNSNSGSSGNYYGTATVYFSPAFSKLPVPSLAVVTSDATRVAASIDSASGGLTANSMRIRVVRQGGTGTTRVFWTAIEPD